MVGLHEVLDGHLLAGLELEQLEQVLGEALQLGPVGQGQQALGAHAQDLRNTNTTSSDLYHIQYIHITVITAGHRRGESSTGHRVIDQSPMKQYDLCKANIIWITLA